MDCPDWGGGDLFFQVKSCQGDIAEGDRVKFNEQASSRHPGRFEAVAVAVLGKGANDARWLRSLTKQTFTSTEAARIGSPAPFTPKIMAEPPLFAALPACR